MAPLPLLHRRIGLGKADAFSTPRHEASLCCANMLPHRGPSHMPVAVLNWSSSEVDKSSTWRELRTVDYGLLTFAHIFSGQAVLWLCDNQAVSSIVRKGSMVPELNVLADHIAQICRDHRVSLHVSWIPRSYNGVADFCSHWIDSNDWSIHPSLFGLLDTLWGPHTIDRFANGFNAQLARFNSRFAAPGAEAVDAFCQCWTGENNWLVPPPIIVHRTLQHLIHDRACGTLIVPEWPSAAFWPVLFPDGRPAWFVTAYQRFCLSLSLYYPW